MHRAVATTSSLAKQNAKRFSLSDLQVSLFESYIAVEHQCSCPGGQIWTAISSKAARLSKNRTYQCAECEQWYASASCTDFAAV